MVADNRYAPKGSKTRDNGKLEMQTPRIVAQISELDNALVARTVRRLAGDDVETYIEVCDMLGLSREAAAMFDLPAYRQAHEERAEELRAQAASA